MRRYVATGNYKSIMSKEKLCKHCNKPVEVNFDYYDIFEGMHWLCFHLVFEHEGDPDKECNDPSCPWFRIGALSSKLEKLGLEAEQVIADAVKEKWKC